MNTPVSKCFALICTMTCLRSFAPPIEYPAPPSQFFNGVQEQQIRQREQAQATEQERIMAAREAAEQARIANWIPDDPWRNINTFTNYARGLGWQQFSGKVVEVQPTGIRVSGVYGEPAFVSYSPENYSYNHEFFVEGFPYQVAEGDVIGRSMHLTAYEDGTYTYKTVTGGSTTLHRLVYGIPCRPPPELIEAQIKFQQEQEIKRSNAVAQAKQQRESASLKWNQEQADQGDPYGLLRMGERYARGDGVETNLIKARAYLMHSAALGNETAKEELEALKFQTATNVASSVILAP